MSQKMQQVGAFSLMPCASDVCQICAGRHSPHEAHNAQSLYYQYRFYGAWGRWPTWADAVAHCDQPTRDFWEKELRNRYAWTQSDGEPIAEKGGVL